MKRLLLVLLVAAAVAPGAPWGQHAYAFDLTGGYEGSMICRGVTDIGEKDTFKCCTRATGLRGSFAGPGVRGQGGTAANQQTQYDLWHAEQRRKRLRLARLAPA